MKSFRLELDLRITLLYVLFGGLWIALTDEVLFALVNDPITIIRLETYKGWFFVAASALLIYGLLRRELNLRRNTENELRRSEERYRLLFETGLDAILLTAPDGSIFAANAAACRMFERTETEITELGRAGIVDATDPRLKSALDERARTGQFSGGLTLVRKDGTKFEGDVSTAVYKDEAGRARTSMIIRDVTVSRQHEARIRQLNRLYATLSQINKTILHVHDQETLFAEICRAAIDQGRYRLAWVGLNDPDSQTVRPVVFAGEEQGYLSNVRISYLDEELGHGPTGTAIREERCVICQDIATHPSMRPWRELALQRGFYSSASVPIRRAGRSIGALTVYAGDRNAFDTSDESLLKEISDNVAFALDSFDLNVDRQRAEVARLESETRFRILSENALTGIYIVQDGRLSYVNPALAKIFGYEPTELLGADPLIVIHPDDRELVVENLRRRLSREVESVQYEFRGLCKNGDTKCIEVLGTQVDLNGQSIIIGNILDITESKQAADRLRFQATLIANMQEAVIATDLHYRILTWNAAAETLYGWTAAEVVGQPMPEFIQTEYLKDTRETAARLAIETGRWSGEVIQTHRNGTRLPILAAVSVIKDDQGQPIGLVAVNRDISELKQATDAVRENERRLRVALQSADIAVFNMDRDLRYTWMYNPQLGYSSAQVVGHTDAELLPLADAELIMTIKRRVVETGQNAREEVAVHLPTGTQYFDLSVEPLLDSEGALVGLTCATLDISERKRTEEQLRLQATALETAANAIMITDSAGTIQWVNPSFTTVTGYTAEESIGRNPRDLVRSGLHDTVFFKDLWNTILSGRVWHGEIINRHKDAKLYTEEQTITPVLDAQGRVTHFVSIKQDITVRKLHERELETMASVAAALRRAAVRAEMLPILLDEVLALLEVAGAALYMRTPTDENVMELGRGHLAQATGLQLAPGEGVAGRVVATGQPYVNNAASNDPYLTRPELIEPFAAVACVPLIVQQNIIGALFIVRQREITIDDIRLLTVIADIAASALHRATLHEQTERRLRQLSSIRMVERTIAGALDLRLVLSVVAEQAVGQLNVDAACVLLYDSFTHTLKYAAGHGFRTNSIERSRTRLGSGQAGRAALEQRTLSIPDLATAEVGFDRATLVQGEHFVSHHVTPLIAKGQLHGVLEVFHRNRLAPDFEWLEFFKMLAQQTAIAIDNAQLFENLQRSNAELSLAYDATIEGWSRALDLRDKETEGHSLRVTELTERLAQAWGLKDDELVNIRRGALLHDIGKMGVPDSILLKPGSLTEEEWASMRRHPQFAYDMLQPIIHLRPALDIPYCHHEKWDGTGYPRGLQGEQIPIAARLFAIVDVWDALCSDRPYRQAWPKEQALEHIRSLAGIHFDPAVVALFIELVRSQ